MSEMLNPELRGLRARHDGLCRGIEATAAELPRMVAGLESAEEVEAVLAGIEAGRGLLADRPALQRARAVLDAVRSMLATEQSRRAVVEMAEQLELHRLAALE